MQTIIEYPSGCAVASQGNTGVCFEFNPSEAKQAIGANYELALGILPASFNAGDSFSVGGQTFTYVTGPATTPFEIVVGATDENSLENTVDILQAFLGLETYVVTYIFNPTGFNFILIRGLCYGELDTLGFAVGTSAWFQQSESFGFDEVLKENYSIKIEAVIGNCIKKNLYAIFKRIRDKTSRECIFNESITFNARSLLQTAEGLRTEWPWTDLPNPAPLNPSIKSNSCIEFYIRYQECYGPANNPITSGWKLSNRLTIIHARAECTDLSGMSQSNCPTNGIDIECIRLGSPVERSFPILGDAPGYSVTDPSLEGPCGTGLTCWGDNLPAGCWLRLNEMTGFDNTGAPFIHQVILLTYDTTIGAPALTAWNELMGFVNGELPFNNVLNPLTYGPVPPPQNSDWTFPGGAGFIQLGDPVDGILTSFSMDLICPTLTNCTTLRFVFWGNGATNFQDLNVSVNGGPTGIITTPTAWTAVSALVTPTFFQNYMTEVFAASGITYSSFTIDNYQTFPLGGLTAWVIDYTICGMPTPLSTFSMVFNNPGFPINFYQHTISSVFVLPGEQTLGTITQAIGLACEGGNILPTTPQEDAGQSWLLTTHEGEAFEFCTNTPLIASIFLTGLEPGSDPWILTYTDTLGNMQNITLDILEDCVYTFDWAEFVGGINFGSNDSFSVFLTQGDNFTRTLTYTKKSGDDKKCCCSNEFMFLNCKGEFERFSTTCTKSVEFEVELESFIQCSSCGSESFRKEYNKRINEAHTVFTDPLTITDDNREYLLRFLSSSEIYIISNYSNKIPEVAPTRQRVYLDDPGLTYASENKKMQVEVKYIISTEKISLDNF